MRLWKHVYLALLGTLLLSLGGLTVILPNRAFSEEENRYLAKFPAFAWGYIRSGEFGKQLEQFVADQFPLRDHWITLKAWLEYGQGKKENNDVYAGKDGYLLQKLPEPAVPLEEQISYVRGFAQAVSMPVYLMLVPNSAAILAEKLPRYAPPPNQKRYVDQVYRMLGHSAIGVDVYDSLREHKDGYIFYRTDHHWTTLGAFRAYRQFAMQAGLLAFRKDEFQLERVSDEFYGSLTAKSKFRHVRPDSIDLWLSIQALSHIVTHQDDGTRMDSLYDWNKLKRRDQYPVFLGGNHALTVIDTPEAAGGTLLLIKDSYAHSIVPLLALHYKSIHMADLRYLNMSMREYAAQIGAEAVLILYNVASFQSDENLKKLGWG